MSYIEGGGGEEGGGMGGGVVEGWGLAALFKYTVLCIPKKITGAARQLPPSQTLSDQLHTPGGSTWKCQTSKMVWEWCIPSASIYTPLPFPTPQHLSLFYPHSPLGPIRYTLRGAKVVKRDVVEGSPTSYTSALGGTPVSHQHIQHVSLRLGLGGR